MGQILQADSIGALSHSSGVITLAASRLTIGGQQYSTAALNRTIATDITMTANSLYMIYAVVSGGVPTLRISANVNSIGPAGFTSWKLVGAFYSSGKISPDFGAFMTIEGVPTMIGQVDSGPMISGVHLVGNVNPTFTTTFYNNMTWWRVGRFLNHDWQLGLNGGGTDGSGAYRLVLPFAVNTNFYTPFAAGNGELASNTLAQPALLPGQGHITHGGPRGRLVPFLYDTTSFWMIGENVDASYRSWSDVHYNLGTGAMRMRMNLRNVPISSWSDTPLKDL